MLMLWPPGAGKTISPGLCSGSSRFEKKFHDLCLQVGLGGGDWLEELVNRGKRMRAAELIGSYAGLGEGLPTSDDYAIGFEAGCFWAQGRGTWSEISGLVSQAHETWFNISLKAEHSLVQFLSEEVWDCDPPARRVKLLREPFTEGVLAGIVSAHQESSVGKGTTHRRR